MPGFPITLLIKRLLRNAGYRDAGQSDDGTRVFVSWNCLSFRDHETSRRREVLKLRANCPSKPPAGDIRLDAAGTRSGPEDTRAKPLEPAQATPGAKSRLYVTAENSGKPDRQRGTREPKILIYPPPSWIVDRLTGWRSGGCRNAGLGGGFQGAAMA